MKYFFNHYYYFFILFFSLFKGRNLSIDLTYPSAFCLINSNIFLIEQKGVYVYDQTLENIINSYSYPFNEEEKINNPNELFNIIIKYQSDAMNNLICLINSKIYFFSLYGYKLLITGKIIEEDNFYHPTLAPI